MKKRLRRLRRFRSSSGFTLVEVIIACALLGILILGMMGFITPVLRSVREKQSDARAYMLSEAINTYIYSATQNAYYVATFSGAAIGDASGATPKIVGLAYSGTEFPKMNKSGNKGLASLKECFDALGTDNYEVRCIGIRWREDRANGVKKLMVTNETVDQVKMTLDPTKSRLVFEDCFYSGLYPMVLFENYSNQYYMKDEKGQYYLKYPKEEEEKFTPQVQPDDVNVAPALGLTVNVYSTPDCYNTDSTVRENAMLAMSGDSAIAFNNIKSTITNSDGRFEIVPNLEVNSYDAAYAKDSAAAFSEEGQTYYYPESFIYYIAHKSILG